MKWIIQLVVIHNNTSFESLTEDSLKWQIFFYGEPEITIGGNDIPI